MMWLFPSGKIDTKRGDESVNEMSNINIAEKISSHTKKCIFIYV